MSMLDNLYGPYTGYSPSKTFDFGVDTSFIYVCHLDFCVPTHKSGTFISDMFL